MRLRIKLLLILFIVASSTYGQSEFNAVSGYSISEPKTTNKRDYFQDLINSMDDGQVLSIDPDSRMDLSGEPITINKRITINANGCEFINAQFEVYADGVKINDPIFIGSDKTLKAIVIKDKTGFHLNNVEVYNYERAIEFGNTKLSGSYMSSTITNAKIYDCVRGILGNENGEYVTISGMIGNNLIEHISIRGGNVLIANCILTGGSHGIKVLGGPNDGHGIIADCQINHQSGDAIHIKDITNGHTLTNNHIYYGGIHIKNSTGISISGGQLASKYYRFENAVGTMMNDIKIANQGSNALSIVKDYGGATPSIISSNGIEELNGTVVTGF